MGVFRSRTYDWSTINVATHEHALENAATRVVYTGWKGDCWTSPTAGRLVSYHVDLDSERQFRQSAHVADRVRALAEKPRRHRW